MKKPNMSPQTTNWTNRTWHCLLAAFALSALVACGGGGGGGSAGGNTGGTNSAPTSVGLFEVSSSAVGAINASWLPASDDSTPAAQIKYQLHASDTVSFTPSVATLMFEGVGITSATVASGLTAGKVYAVRLVAMDSSGASTSSDAMQVTVSNTTATAVSGAVAKTLLASQVASVTDTAVVLQAGVVAPKVGAFVSSADANGGNGYLRKVVGVTQAGGASTLQTVPASINEVVSDIQISSTFKMDAIPTEVAKNAVQAGLATVGTPMGDGVQHTFNWPETGLRYVSGVSPILDSASAHQLGLVLSAGFKADNDVSMTGKWGKVTGENRIEIKEGASGESKLRVFVTSNDKPLGFNRSAVGICKVVLGTVTSSSSDGAPDKVSVSLGEFKQVASDGSRLMTADQIVKFSAAASAAIDKPYKVTATAYLDDVDDGCNGDNFGLWTETIEIDLEIFVTADAFPEAEATNATFDGSAGFSVKNNIVTTFSPKVTFDKTLSGASLTYARMGVQASPRVDQTLTIDATAQGTMDKTVQVINPRKFFKVYVTPAGIPIVVSGELRLDMRIKGDVSGELHAKETLTIGYDDISFGLEYKDNKFVPFHSVKPVYRLKVGGQGKAEANLTISLLPSLEITGYEVLTGKAVLEPYMTASAGVEGHVQLDADVVFNTGQLDVASDADYRLTKTRLEGGVNAWLYADFHIWDKPLLVWPETAKKADYTTYEPIVLLAKTTIMDLPVLSAFLPTGSGTVHPQDSCAIKVRAIASNVPNPLHSTFPFMDASYITWQRWTPPLIVQQLGVPSSSYSFLPDPNGEESVFWARMTQPGTYKVRMGGYSNWGTWARQYTEIEIDATDANANGIPDWWESRYGLSGTGAAIAAGDADGDGKTNLQEWQQCSDPKVGTDFVNIHATPGSLTVLESVSVWISEAYQTVKTVLWDFGAGIASQTASVANGLSTTISQAFDSVGLKTITASLKDAAGVVLGQVSTTVNVLAAPLPAATITNAISDSTNQPGPIANNASTDDTTPTLSGTISATLTSGQKVNVYDGEVMFPQIAIHNGTSWTFTPVTPLIGGVHRFTAEVAGPDGTPGVRSAQYVVNVLSTSVASISPGEIMRTLTGTFEVVGSDLPTTGITVTVRDDPKAVCQSPSNMTASGFNLACTFYMLGEQVLEIRKDSKLLGTVMVLVKSNVTGVTWTSQSTAFSGTVNFGETVTFFVAGVNLTADPTMGFAVQLCGVSNVEVGTPSLTQRSFTCYWNNQAGAVAGLMPGVVKDAPGGQVLFDGWKVPVSSAAQTTPIEIPATAFLRGQNVALIANGGGLDALGNGPPYLTAANAAEWDFAVPTAGTYELFAEYAAALSRPVVISFNGLVRFNSALGAITGGWLPANRQILSQGYVELSAGATTMRVSRGDVFPHIKGFKLVPVPISTKITGSQEVTAVSEAGSTFIFPDGAGSCTFAASGNWNASSLADGLVDATGFLSLGAASTVNPSKSFYLPSAPVASLIASTPDGYVYVGSNRTLTYPSGTSINFKINDTVGNFSDNTGSLTVSYMCSAAMGLFSDDFSSSVFDLTKWALRGTPSISGGYAQFPALSRIDTKEKIAISGKRIVIEARLAGQGGSRDTSIQLVDSMSNDSIYSGDTSYAGWGFFANGSGAYNFVEIERPAGVGASPQNCAALGGSTNQFMEYRWTLEGNKITFERGLTLSNITQSATRTLGQSIVGRSFYLSIGTASAAYSPGTWDWVRVNASSF